MKGKRKSPRCRHCHHHPTKRVYVKDSNVFKGIAWVCALCDEFTHD